MFSVCILTKNLFRLNDKHANIQKVIAGVPIVKVNLNTRISGEM